MPASLIRSRWIHMAAAASLMACAGAGAFAQRATAERHIFVTVVDRNDAPVKGLPASEFVVREDGLAREILRVAPAADPMQIALLVDDSQASQPLITDLRIGMASFVSQMFAAGAAHEMALWSFGERPTKVADFTSAEAVIKRATEQILPRSGAGAHMMDAVVEAAKALKKRAATRPVVVVFVIESGPEFSSPSHQIVQDALKDAGASLWVIALQSRGTASQTTEQRERSSTVADVSTASGGGLKVALTQQSIDVSFRTVASWLTSQYDVTYGRPDTLIPPTKREASVKRDGVRVMASRWAGR